MTRVAEVARYNARDPIGCAIRKSVSVAALIYSGYNGSSKESET
tara:strand:+ start:444 stop:575 length:132 start_codon:yes stop_codon:yes gene_type:complete